MLSPKNLAKLKQKKYRQKYGLFLIEGTKGVKDALQTELEIEQIVYTRDWQRQNQNFLHSRKVKEIQIQQVDDSILKSIADSTSPQGVIAAAKIPAMTIIDYMNRHSRNVDKQKTFGISKPITIVILEDIRDPGNLGTMIRTSDWFGVNALLLIGGADPYQPKVIRSSMGSIGHVPIFISENSTEEIKILKDNGFSITTTRPELATSEKLKTEKHTKQALIFGNESFGTSSHLDSLADTSISIPKFGMAESLNVAVSYGIVLFEITKNKVG